MSIVNNIQIKGRLADDVQSRKVAINGKDRSVANFGVVVNEGDKTTYFPVVAWGVHADNAAKFLTKGQEVDISGRADFQEKTYKLEDGKEQKIHKFSLVAEDIRYGAKAKTQENQTDKQSEDVME